LKEILKTKNLLVSGSKEVLIKRILEFYSGGNSSTDKNLKRKRALSINNTNGHMLVSNTLSPLMQYDMQSLSKKAKFVL